MAVLALPTDLPMRGPRCSLRSAASLRLCSRLMSLGMWLGFSSLISFILVMYIRATGGSTVQSLRTPRVRLSFSVLDIWEGARASLCHHEGLFPAEERLASTGIRLR